MPLLREPEGLLQQAFQVLEVWQVREELPFAQLRSKRETFMAGAAAG
jgi:hypothetical protein